jgi:hypothetical protein
MKLTKIFTLLVLILLLSTNFTNAQIKLGGYSGVTFMDVSVTPTTQTSSRTGFLFGAIAEFKFAKMFYLQPSLHYIMKGTSQTAANETYSTKLNYLEIPLLLKVKFELTEFKPYFVAGPTLGIKLSATSDYSGPNGTQSTDISSNIAGTDFGLNFGLGGEFALNSKTDIFIDFHYQLGLTNINNIAGSTTTYKNIGFQIWAGAKFGL